MGRSTPQGGIISPTLANMVLNGLERVVLMAVSRNQKVNVIVYADDFIITGASQEVLVEKVKPAVVAFLKERGLELSEEKTKITHIEDGFDFLGFNVRKYAGKLLIKPAKCSVKSFLADIREFIKSNKAAKTESLIWQLNPRIRGWANYYRHCVAKKTFSYVDHQVFQVLCTWINRRHPNKSVRWKRQRYFRNRGLRNWVFFASTRNKQDKAIQLDLVLATDVAIIRHIKIRADATPYDPTYVDYFKQRAQSRRASPQVWSGLADKA